MIVARALYAATITFATAAYLSGAPAALAGLLLCVGAWIALDSEVMRRAGGAR